MKSPSTTSSPRPFHSVNNWEVSLSLDILRDEFDVKTYFSWACKPLVHEKCVPSFSVETSHDPAHHLPDLSACGSTSQCEYVFPVLQRTVQARRFFPLVGWQVPDCRSSRRRPPSRTSGTDRFQFPTRLRRCRRVLITSSGVLCQLHRIETLFLGETCSGRSSNPLVCLSCWYNIFKKRSPDPG